MIEPSTIPFQLKLKMSFTRALSSAVEAGDEAGSPGWLPGERHRSLRGVRHLGQLHHGHPGADGGTLRVSAHAAVALVILSAVHEQFCLFRG